MAEFEITVREAEPTDAIGLAGVQVETWRDAYVGVLSDDALIDLDEMQAVALSLEGQLTATLHMDEGDTETGRKLMPVLERKAGRVLVNGFPTGVEVCDSMVHGGPYPASTNFGATSVGTLAIRRFLRPVCYQNIPLDLLPEMA